MLDTRPLSSLCTHYFRVQKTTVGPHRTDQDVAMHTEILKVARGATTPGVFLDDRILHYVNMALITKPQKLLDSSQRDGFDAALYSPDTIFATVDGFSTLEILSEM